MHGGLPGASLYGVTKAAVHNLTHTLSIELAPKRIRVNSVSPGYIETSMFHDNITADAHAAVITRVVIGRLGTADDVAAAVAFLAPQARRPAPTHRHQPDVVGRDSRPSGAQKIAELLAATQCHRRGFADHMSR
ncbi:SDR family oxidoreductase [Nocardia sp. NBC_00565]|uniref:SDR family oxidoreductase n=1 Tax=Nocardia sp. NBC_00565 TaxID=2975993 RepID=UPI003FA59087